MTLSTNVYVLGEIEPTEAFRFCQELLKKRAKLRVHKTILAVRVALDAGLIPATADWIGVPR